MSGKHFNMGNVWGRVSKVKPDKSETGTPYLSVEVECPNELYGNVKTYGRIWGSKGDTSKIDEFMAYYKDHPGQAYRFKAFFSQYDKEAGQRFSNFTFFGWAPYDGKEFRASFILVGDLLSAEKIGNETRVHMHLVREGKGTYKDVEEMFEIYAFEPQQLDGIEEGDLIEAAGFIRAREPEDEFGRQVGTFRPYAMDIKKRKSESDDKSPEEVTGKEAF